MIELRNSAIERMLKQLLLCEANRPDQLHRTITFELTQVRGRPGSRDVDDYELSAKVADGRDIEKLHNTRVSLGHIRESLDGFHDLANEIKREFFNIEGTLFHYPELLAGQKQKVSKRRSRRSRRHLKKGFEIIETQSSPAVRNDGGDKS